ncbi:unnamed protein product [Didymodactylos carnosus]|uniref:Uncharacterized protein n=1 Tax=Didymodactylos carnosus TaxID=1234261 RepID=A0A814WM13_9BILA|nr:unnamed protein product [Didymodactylos carnosus]CAF1204060.1 unnamed protein product [Didymodactylos carnosus]CAF3859143.1 unnamed protein product [Didymodactylos carnosus]CAF3968378.1 unnamed protein product [Didymodactylos carnosus]
MASDDQQSDQDDNNNTVLVHDVLNDEKAEERGLIDNIVSPNSHQRPWSDFTVATSTGKQEPTNDDTVCRRRDRGKSAPPLQTPIEDYRHRIRSHSTQKPPLTNTSQYRKSRPYKFIQLQHALMAAGLLKSDDDRKKFEFNYLQVHDDRKKFDLFVNDYYSRIAKHLKDIGHAEFLRKSRAFACEDLVTNFRALDPSRDIKIEFANYRTSKSDIIDYLPHTKSGITTTHTFDEYGDLFYEQRVDRLLKNQSRARDEITLFAKKASENLHEKFPQMNSVPHCVKIIDHRDITGPSARTIAFQHHRRKMSIMAKRRNTIMKMLGSTQKYQMKTMQLMHGKSNNYLDSVRLCHELVSRAEEIEKNIRDDYLDVMRPSRNLSTISDTSHSLRLSNLSQQVFYTSSTTGDRSERSTSTTLNDKSSLTTATTTSSTINDALSLKQIEQENGRVITPKLFRQLHTAHVKTSWVNYV